MIYKKYLKHFRDFKNLFLGLILWILIIIPLVLPIFVLFFLLRHFVHFLARIYKPDLISINNLADAALIFIPSCANPSMNCSQVWKVQGKLKVSEFRDHFYKCFLSTEELREKYRNFYCYFVQWMFYCFKKPVETIMLEEHIREYFLVDGVTLEQFVGKWMTQGTYAGNETNCARPSWEILIIHCNKNNNHCGTTYDETESVILFKIHHGLSDGYTFVHLVEKLTGIKSPYHFKKEEFSLINKIKLVIKFPKLWLDYHPKQAFAKDILHPRKQKDPKWFISFSTLNLEAIKNIRRVTNTNFNSVIMTAFVGALRRHFLETGKVSKVSELPEVTWVGGALGLPHHPAMTHGGMTNHLTLGGFRVPLKDPDINKRLKSVDEDYDLYLELGMDKIINWVLFRAIWAFPACFNRFAGNWDNFGFLRCTTYVSPLMCSESPYQILGLPVKNLYLPVLTSSLSMYTSMYVIPVSHSGQIDLSINASTEVVADQVMLDRFTQVYFKEELDKMIIACLPQNI